MLIAGCKPKRSRKVNQTKCDACGKVVPRRRRCGGCVRMVCKSCEAPAHVCT